VAVVTRRTFPYLRLVALAVAIGAIACAFAVHFRGETPVELRANDARLSTLGAFDRSDPAAPRFAWPAAELRLAFRGESVSVELTDTPFEDELRDTDWIGVQIDDRPTNKLALQEGRHRYLLAEGLPLADHRLRIVKRTEAEVGTITLHGFTFAAGTTVLPSSRLTRRILFVGDSITAGYGNEGPNELCHYSPNTCNADLTFATFAARELKAEAVMSAWSGKGVLRNFDPDEPLTMPSLFDRVIPTDPMSIALPTQPAPDAIVVNLGTNDFFSGTPDEEAFLAASRGLLERLRVRAPQAPLCLIVSPMLADDSPQPNARANLKRWLTTLKAECEQRGTKVTLLEQWTYPNEGLGCDYHPSLRTHERLGRELATALRAQTGW